jgi:branched-chain amino acid transport system ATP-binding protein
MILLDEVMAGLRPSEADEVVALIRDLRQRGITFVVVEHIMDVIMAISDRIVVIGAGRKVAEGRPEEVVRDPHVIEIYLGGEFELA